MALKLISTGFKCPDCHIPLIGLIERYACEDACCKNEPGHYDLILGHDVYQCPKCFNKYYEEKDGN